jgi:nucleoside-diphosphate-sugar epimerase
MQGLKILITGASGFLGSNLRERLLDRQFQVHATSRTRRDSDHPNLHWWQCDLQQFSAVQSLFDEVRPDIVYHLAGHVSAAPDMDLVLPTFDSLLGSSLNVLAAGTSSGCQRIVTIGSLTEPSENLRDPTPSSPYAAAKWAATAYARMFHKLYETPVVILRLFMTYGPRQRDTKILPYVIRSLLQGSAPSLSSGRWGADWIFVDDAVDAFVLAATRPGIDGCTIDVGTGTLTSIRDVVHTVVELIDPVVEPQFGVLADRPDEEVRVADTESAKAILDWSANTSLEQGLAATVRWYRDRLSLATAE